MSIINLFTKKAPSLGSGDSQITFDAVIDDVIETKIDYTQFPIEIGADATDHGIIRPIKYTLRGLVSNNPLQTQITDFAGGVLSNFFDNAIVQSVAGLSAGFLAGSDQTRAGSTLEFLIALQYARQPFDVDAVDYQLQNMVITSIRRERNTANENGLEFVAEMQELPLLSTVITQNQPGISQLPGGDPAETMAASEVNKGEVLGLPISDTIQQGIDRLAI